jgi:hypothetical protein
MQVDEKQFDVALHCIPIVIQHLQRVQVELMELRQKMLMSVEEQTKDFRNI